MSFFQCPNCKNVWQYPIGKCPECFSSLTRLKTKRAKVIGVSKVSIPSLFHPKVPYFVLVLEDELGNRWIQKSEKEYKISDEFVIEKTSEKDAVAIWRVRYDFYEAIEKTIETLGGLKISSDSKILILPTIEKPSHPYLGDNTSPEFLKEVLTFLFDIGARRENIKVGSQSFDETPIALKAERSQLLMVCQKLDVSPLDLAQQGFAKNGDLEISEEALNADLIFNIPILKTGKAQATENLFVLLKKENLFSQRYLYSEKEIFENLMRTLEEKGLKIFTIAEGKHIQAENGSTFYLNLLFSSFCPQAIDRVFLEVINWKKIPEIIEDLKIENIKIVGRSLEEIRFSQ